jgi:hypothetical protein
MIRPPLLDAPGEAADQATGVDHGGVPVVEGGPGAGDPDALGERTASSS